MEDKLRAFLKRQAVLTELVGERIYPRRLPQKVTLPALVYQRLGTRYTSRHGERSSFPRPSIQMRSWAKTTKAAWQVADALRGVLDGYRGPMGTLQVTRSVITNELEDDDPETGLVSVIQEFLITFKE